MAPNITASSVVAACLNVHGAAGVLNVLFAKGCTYLWSNWGVECSVRQWAHLSVVWPKYEKTLLQCCIIALLDTKASADTAHLS